MDWKLLVDVHVKCIGSFSCNKLSLQNRELVVFAFFVPDFIQKDKDSELD